MNVFPPAIAIACLLTSSAHAASLWCYGNITNVYVTVTGDVVARGTYRSDYTQVCNLNSEWKGVLPQTCWSWLGLLTSAKTNQTGVTVMYDTTTTCATLPTYGEPPPPAYVMLGQ